MGSWWSSYQFHKQFMFFCTFRLSSCSRLTQKEGLLQTANQIVLLSNWILCIQSMNSYDTVMFYQSFNCSHLWKYENNIMSLPWIKFDNISYPTSNIHYSASDRNLEIWLTETNTICSDIMLQKEYRLRRIYTRTVDHRFWLAAHESLN